MPTRIELLKQAGFSDSEIGDWATAERRRMLGAGFTDSEIDDEFGVTRPPKEVPAAFVERMKQGNWFHRIIGTAGEYAQDYFGEEPFGFSPENQEALRKLGVVGDIIIPAAKPVDAVLRSASAGIAGVSAGFGQALEEGQDAAFGPGAEAKGKAARDFAQFAQIAAVLLGLKGRAGAIRAPVPNPINERVMALPRAEDFRNAAATISGTQASFQTEQKLLRLWTDHGIPPSEVAQDAMRDRTIAENIRSDSEKLPDVYAGGERTTTPTSPQNVPAQLAEPVQADSTAVPAESRAAATAADDNSLANLNAAHMIAEGKRIPFRRAPLEPQRSFADDYATAPPTDGRGRLLTDIEGRPLGAKFIAGRRRLGKADEPLWSEDIRAAIAEAGIPIKDMRDAPPDVLEPGAKRPPLGVYAGNIYSNHPPDGEIYLRSRLSVSDRNFVTAHEFAHAIEHFTGNALSETLTPGEIAELRSVYGDLRAKGPDGFQLQPENYGYRGKYVNSELIAEGLRAYMTNPNYFKTVAPMTAAKIRAIVNDSPLLKKAIQFNSLAAAGLAGAGAGNQDRDKQ